MTTLPENLTQHFQELIANDRLNHLYLVVDGTAEQRLAFAQWLAIEAVGQTARERILLGDHPDVLLRQPENGAVLKVDQIRSLRGEFVTASMEAPLKVFILAAAETMTTSAANSLLKFIEEPAGPQLILLLAQSGKDVLPTIRSRAQAVSLFGAVGEATRTDVDAAWAKDMETLLLTWLDLIVRQQIQAFAFVQTTLLPNIHDDAQETFVLEMWQKIWRDVVTLPFVGEAGLRLVSGAEIYRLAEQRFALHQLSEASAVVLADDALRKVNVTLQARLEKMALELSRVLQ